MYGINASTGRHLGGIDHLRQSITDILTTPLGSRVMRRTYGSRLFDLIDKPYSPSTRLDILAATVEAIMRWEPRVAVESVALRAFEPGRIRIDMVGRYLPDGRDISIQGIEVV